MEHAAAWVSHVPLSLLDYNTQTGGPAEARGGKKEMRKCGLEFAQALCLIRTHTRTNIHSHTHPPCQSSQSVIKDDWS